MDSRTQDRESILDRAIRTHREAHAALIGGRYLEAIRLAEKGLELLNALPPTERRDHVRYALLLERGRARAMLGEYAAISDFQIVRQEATAPLQRIEALVGIADCRAGSGDYPTAEAAYLQALEEAEDDEESTACRVRGWIGLGTLYWKQGRVDEAIETLSQARSALQRQPDVYEMGRTLINLGIAYTYSGRLDQALQAYEDALDCFRTLKDAHRTAAVLNNLGELHQELLDLEAALRYHEEARAIASEAGAERISIDVIRNLGVDLLLLGRYSEAMSHLEEALARARALGDKDVVLQALYSLADARLRQGQVEQAAALASELEAEARAIHSELHLARARFIQGRIFLARGDRAAARTVLQNALADAHALPSRTLLWQLHAVLGRATDDPQIADLHRRIAADFIRETVEALPDPRLRQRFLSRPEVQAVLRTERESS